MTADPSAPLSPRPAWRRALVALRNGLLFVLGLGATSAMLTAYAPFPQLGNLWRKYQHVEERAEAYSLIYLGSSRVFHEFIPKQFDAALQARGHQVRSFNFGQDGMWPPESFYMLRRVLELRPPNLKWVFIDLMGIKSDLVGNEATMRAVYWHDTYHSWLAWRHVLEVDMEGQRSSQEKADLIWRHTELWMQKSTGLGRGQERLETALKLSKPKKTERVPDEGFEVGGKGPLQGEMLEGFNASVAKLRDNPPAKPIQPVLRDGLEKIIADVRAAGAEPIFVVAAGIYGAERFTDWPPPGVRVLRFDDPIKYPDLYDPANRYDPHHLDLAGAQNFTRHLANAFAALLEEKP